MLAGDRISTIPTLKFYRDFGNLRFLQCERLFTPWAFLRLRCSCNSSKRLGSTITSSIGFHTCWPRSAAEKSRTLAAMTWAPWKPTRRQLSRYCDWGRAMFSTALWTWEDLVLVSRRGPHKSETRDRRPQKYPHGVLGRPRRRYDQLAPTSSKVYQHLLRPKPAWAARSYPAQRAKYALGNTDSTCWQCHTSSICPEWELFRGLRIPSCSPISLQPRYQSVPLLSRRGSENEIQRWRIRDTGRVAGAGWGVT
jgi:hypothetical protein